MKPSRRVSLSVAVPLFIMASLACLAFEETGRWTRAYRFVHPFALGWPDRRPIGSLFLARDATGWPDNPRGWFNDPHLSVFTPQGQARFRELLWSRADAAINNLHAADAQGVIIWDLEGQQYPHPGGSYVGDPTNLERIAPEMAAVADAFFARFRSAHLRVGLCLRPQALRFRPDGSFVQAEPFLDQNALFHNLDRKIRYARERWGCTLFYVDSNFGLANLGLYDVRIFRKLHDRYPDVLLIPEHQNLTYFAVSAPYYDPNGTERWPGTRRLAQDPPRPYNRAFSVVNVANLEVTPEWCRRLIRLVDEGNVLLFRGWLAGNDLELVRIAYGRGQVAVSGNH